MAIKSSNNTEKKERLISSKEKKIDVSDNSLRPKSLADYIGQKNIKKHLSVSIESAKIRKDSLEHILFYGPPGL
jgi:Holliday junction DNA helicase RuvB